MALSKLLVIGIEDQLLLCFKPSNSHSFKRVGSSYRADWEGRSPYSRLKEDAIDGKKNTQKVKL